MRNILLCLILLPVMAVAQPPVSLNMTFFANVDLGNLPSQSGFQYSDVWGYTTPNGTEIAIIALIEEIMFVDVTNPAFPVIIYEYQVNNISTPPTTVNHSLWRDFDTYQHYIYAVSDQGTSGLLIFDMSNAPATITPVLQTNQFFNRSHTLFIDQPNGRLYAAGTNTQSNGLKILDLTNPINPVQVGAIALNTVGGGYVHDVFVRDNIAYCSHGSLHKIQMYDFSNLPSFSVVGVIENYPEPGYNHSSWLDESGYFMVFCDETFGSDVKLVDISDPLNISSNDFSPFYSELLGPGVPGQSVAHNPYIVGDLAYISYYEDGVQVFNIADPDSITLFAYYDTKPDNTQYNGFVGCWGVYPFFPSGTILGSDMNNGLFIMEIQNLPLGINFISFQATRKKQGIQLDWTVGDVSNGNKFEVKRSLDNGTTFETIGTVKLSSPQSHYTYLDENVFPQHKYIYRIDFVEFDGRKVKSPIRSITAGFSEITLKVVNPISSNLIIDLMKPVEALALKLFDLEGRLVWSDDDDDPGTRIEKDINDVIAGSYILTANWSGGNENVLVQVVK